MSNENELPSGVRQVPSPATRWEVTTQSGIQFDGYVFEDDPSDLAKFLRWLATSEPGGQSRSQLVVSDMKPWVSRLG